MISLLKENKQWRNKISSD